MNDLLQIFITYFEGWLELLTTGKEDLEKIVAELKSLSLPREIQPKLVPTIEQWLSQALAGASAPPCEPLLTKLGQVYESLRWMSIPDDYLGPAFAARYSYTQLVGLPIFDNQGTLFASDTVACGFSLQAPGTFYPPHSHTSVEFYGVLSGVGVWQIYDNQPIVYDPGSTIYHPSMSPHAMLTKDEPLLLIWAWYGDLSRPVKLPSQGWL